MHHRLVGRQFLFELTGAKRGEKKVNLREALKRELFKGGVIEVCELRCATRFMLLYRW